MAKCEPGAVQGRISWAGLFLGPVLAIAAYALLPGARTDETGAIVGGLSPAGRTTTALAVLMATWWLSEAIPLAATALLPVALFPILGVTRDVGVAAAPYADKVIFLFLGGLILASAMERCGLHRRIALVAISLVGTRPTRLVGGVMLAGGFLSMWVSNTATAAMLLPIGTSLVALVEKQCVQGGGRAGAGANFATAMMLGIAYAANIGGVGTLIGTPPNAIFASSAERLLGRDIGFLEWMMVGVPIVAVLLPIGWIYLTRLAFPIRIGDLEGGPEMIRVERESLGPMTRGEWAVLAVFLATAGAWMLRAPVCDAIGWFQLRNDGVTRHYPLSDEGIAIIAAVALFVIPVRAREREFAMDWESAQRLPWGVLILFGGGLSLASAMEANGVTVFIGDQFAVLRGVPPIVMTLVVTLAVIFLTELASNTALATTLMPVLAGAAAGIGTDPISLMLPAAVGATCAFMMPVGTPPNALVFSTGCVTMAQMVRAGIWMNLISAGVITAAAMLLGGLLR